MYLFNYIHKLEYLISKTQKDRANYKLKFKKLVSHIVHSFTNKNLLNENLERMLKLIDIMSPQDNPNQGKKEIRSADVRDINSLLRLIEGTSKSSINSNKGYVSKSTHHDQLYSSPGDLTMASNTPYGTPRVVNWVKDAAVIKSGTQSRNPFDLTPINKIAQKLNRQAGADEPTPIDMISQNHKMKCENDNSISLLMQAEWKSMPKILKDIQSQKTTIHEDEVKLRHVQSESITNHFVYHNEAINNIDMVGQFNRKNTAPMTENHNLGNMTKVSNLNPKVGMSNGHQGQMTSKHDQLQSNQSYDFSYSNGNIDDKIRQMTADPKDDIYQLLKPSPNMNGGEFSYDMNLNNANFLDFDIKGKKRGRRKKQSVDEEH